MSVEFYAFLIAAFVVAMTPGPALIYVAAFSLRYGTVAGFVSALSVNVGSYVLILVAALGLYPVLQAIPQLIEIIQVAGGFYLVYLALKMWPRKTAAPDPALPPEAGYKRLFARGMVTTLLNPKDILFYLLFIPTFIPEPEGTASFLTSFLVLSFAYALIGLVTKCAIALLAGKAKVTLAPKGAVIVNTLSALTLGGLGLFVLQRAYARMSG